MGSPLFQNRRSRHRSDRRLQAASNFLKFSPSLLRLRLLPTWVFLSLAANGFLLAIVLALGLRQFSPTPASLAASSTPQQDEFSLTEVDPMPAPDSELGQRHQLTYEEWQELLAQEASVVAEQRPERLAILAGDSISLWFPEEYLPSDRTWLNQGISGETSVGLLRRLDLFDQTLPDTIFVMIGINDLIRGTNELTVLENQRQIVNYLKDVHPQAQIVLQSILPHAAEQATWEGRDRLLTLPNSEIRAMNRQIEQMANEEGVYFLDLYSLFADDEGDLRMELSTDGLHLNQQGFYVWSIALKVYEQQVLETAQW
ncbi:GDSL-type esterase/lipase family protein [Egbenema bharatensis]|uniref:GDSL-type esterase/lipase family protein n=1 Tax=Egbenema bharatensis TaxID=3463334 RepID=UPI003A867620